jgi:hypothetical protein
LPMNPLFSFSGLLASAARCAGVIYIVLIRFLNTEREDDDEYLVLRTNVAGSTQDHGCGGVWVEPFTSCCCFSRFSQGWKQKAVQARMLRRRGRHDYVERQGEGVVDKRQCLQNWIRSALEGRPNASWQSGSNRTLVGSISRAEGLGCQSPDAQDAAWSRFCTG